MTARRARRARKTRRLYAISMASTVVGFVCLTGSLGTAAVGLLLIAVGGAGMGQ